MLKGLFGAKTPPPPEKPAAYTPQLLAGLLVEAAKSDGHYPAAEKALIDRALMFEFNVDQQRAAGYRADAESAEALSDDARKFSKIAQGFTEAQKAGIIQSLWRVVLADRERDYWESKFMKRAGKVLQVSDRDLNRALKEAEKALRRKRR
jgi:uncharacterized tellurite resistance protein B-like protein